MKLLITGATGQVGSALGSRLAAIGSIIASDRTTLDLSQLEALPCIVERMAPDVIINCAAYTAVDQAENEQALATLVNARAPGVLARWAAQRAVPLIHFSSDYVFSGEGERPWREGDTPTPLSAYGRSKLAGEHEVQAAGGSSLIVRTSWVYGANGRNFLRTITRLARECEELRIVADQIGAPTSARCLAEVIANMLAPGIDDLRAQMAQAQGLLHVSASGEASWHQFACAIVDGLRSRGAKLSVTRIVPIRSEEYATRARRPHNSRLDLRRLREVFGLVPPSWEQDLGAELDAVASEFAGVKG
jgi:dTDP-4-dehydrorhamnose reductase